MRETALYLRGQGLSRTCAARIPRCGLRRRLEELDCGCRRVTDAQANALQKNTKADAQIGSALQKANCTGTVNTQLTQRAHSSQEKQVAKKLAGACGDIVRALQAAKSGNAAQAKQLAGQALSQAKSATP